MDSRVAHSGIMGIRFGCLHVAKLELKFMRFDSAIHDARRACLCAGVLMVFGFTCLWAVAAPDDAVPQRILMGITSDPAHSHVVTWRTSAPTATPQGQIAPLSPHPSLADSATTVNGSSSEYITGAGDTVVHYEVTFSNLEPGQRYAYRVGDGATWSEWFHIRTASDSPRPFRILYLGDAQRNVKALWSRAVRAAFMAAPDAALVLHAGDLIEDGYKDEEWAEWCHGLGFIGAVVPHLPAVGNHDMSVPEGAAPPTAVHPLWKAHLALPHNGPLDTPMLEEEAYWVDYQGVRLIVIEGNAYSPEMYDPEARELVQASQVRWMERLLSDNPNRWTIVLCHEPMYGVGRNPDNPELRAAFLSLYDKYGVDLVLQGHDHVYSRSHKLSDNQAVAPDAPGTVYAVSVSGPRMYKFNPTYEHLMKKVIPDTQMYHIVDVAPDCLRFQAYSVDDVWVDGFELRKDESGKSTLVELSKQVE